MRVLLTADGAGASWRHGIDLARGLAGLGIETVIARIGQAATDDQKASATAIPGLRLVETGLDVDLRTADPFSIRKAGQQIARLAGACAADLVQLHSAALAADVRFGRSVVAVHNSCVATWWESVQGAPLPEDFAWRSELVAAGLRAADIVVTPTAAFSEVVQRRYALAARPRAVHHGREPIGIPSGVPRDFVLTAGRLWDEANNLATLDGAAAHIGVPVRAAGPIRAPNGAEVMFEHLHCLGTLGDGELARWLSARPVFVSTALYEPFGPAIVEAAAAGCALILSDIPTFRELWEEVAIFVDPRDERAVTDAIAALVADDFERAVLGRAAKERAGLYTPAAMASQMASIYRGLLPPLRRPVLAAKAA